MIFSTQTDVASVRFGIEKGCDVIMDAGFKAIDISLYDGKTAYRDDYKELTKELKSRADARGVIFNQAHAPFGGGFEHYTKVTIPRLPRVFEFVSLLGVRQIIVHPVQNGQYYGHEKELFDYNVKFYKELSRYSKEYGVKIALENMWQFHPVNRQIVDDVCAPPQELADMFDALDDDEAFTVCLDIGHVALCRREPADAIKLLGHDRLGALHVHDVDYVSDLHTLPGMGKINWDSVCRALGEINYKGEFTFEADNFLTRFDDAVIPEAIHFMASVGKHLSDKVDSYRA